MNKILKLSLLFCWILTAVNLSANSKSSDQVVNTVALAKQADNKAHVTLTGVIVKRDGNYFIRDLTGQIKLDFPPAKKIDVTTNVNVIITGKIKTNLLRLITKNIEPTVRVNSLKIAQPLSDTEKSLDNK